MTSKKKKRVVEALKACILTIRAHHGNDYCPTIECAACNARRKAEEALKFLEGE